MTGSDELGVFERALAAARVILFQQDAERRYLWITRAFPGHAVGDITGQREEDFLPPGLARVAVAEKERALRTGEARTWFNEFQGPNGPRILQVRVQPTRDAEGRIDGLVGGAIDVTSDKQAEHSVRASERMLREVLDNLFAFVGVLDPDGRMIEANRAPLEAAGLERADVLGRPFWDCAWWAHSPAMQERLKDTVARVREGATLRYDATMQVAAGPPVTLDFQLAPLRNDRGEVIRLVASGTDITWRKNAERDLQTALVRTELALEAGQTGVWEWDVAGGAMVWDARMRHLFDLPPDAPVSFEILEALIHREDVLKTREATAAATDPEGDAEYDVEFRLAPPPPLPGQMGSPPERWVALRGRSIFEDGRAVRMIGIGRDISERKQREAHVHMLMREIAHRSKNLLAVIQAMARQTATAGGTAKEFETRFTARLEALAGSQDLLVMQDWHGASITDLARSQLVHYADLIGVRIHVSGPDLLLKPEAAQNIGLALHELSTNAAKYGALSTPGGQVRLAWEIVRQEAPRDPRISPPCSDATPEDAPGATLRMVWEETGGPPVAPPEREGFGHKVLKRIAAHALEGHVTLNFHPDGLVWRMEIPTSYIVRPREPGEAAVTPPANRVSALGAGPNGGRV